MTSLLTKFQESVSELWKTQIFWKMYLIFEVDFLVAQTENRKSRNRISRKPIRDHGVQFLESELFSRPRMKSECRNDRCVNKVMFLPFIGYFCHKLDIFGVSMSQPTHNFFFDLKRLHIRKLWSFENSSKIGVFGKILDFQTIPGPICSR
jgi:hypothetical protein